MTLLSKANLAVRALASQDPRDPMLNCVYITQDGATVACNGRVMMVVGPVNEEQVNFPEVDGGRAKVPTGGICAPLDIILDALHNLPKDKRLSLQHLALTKCSGGKLEFTTVSERKERRVSGPEMENRFPAWMDILRGAKQDTTAGRVCLNRKDLINLLLAMEEACPDPGESPIFIEFGGEQDGLLLQSINFETGQRGIGYLMPLDTHGTWLKPDTWVDKLFRIVRRVVKRITRDV